MTVKELVKALTKCPPDAQVCIDFTPTESSSQIVTVSYVLGGDGVEDPYVQLTTDEVS